MSTPPEEPRPQTNRPTDRPTPVGGLQGRRPGLAFLALFSAIVLIIVAIAAVVLLLSPPATTLSAVDASSTIEAHTFATAEVYRQATRDAENAASTAQAQDTEEAQAQASATARAYANITATRSAQATIQAPPTLTARAYAFLQEQADAQATVQAVDPVATQVFGPSAGHLAHNPSGTAVCDDTHIKLRNFVAQARFYNPYPIDQDWDYGIAFTNPSDGSEYSLALDADNARSFRLQAPGYYVDDHDTTDLIDNSDRGSNLMKLYVVNGVAHLYINGKFDTTLDLSGLNLGNAIDEPHDLKICTGLRDGDMQPGKSTRYEDFTVWKLP
jgi:hypothetical protein